MIDNTQLRLTVNGKSHELSGPATVAHLLTELGVRVDYVAVEVNATLVPRADHDQRWLADGDCVEVVTLVGGG